MLADVFSRPMIRLRSPCQIIKIRNRRFRIGFLLLGLAGCIFYPAIAEAQTFPGLYVGGAVGPNFAESILSKSGNTDIFTRPGPAANLDVGYAFGNGLRFELEGDYRSNPVSGILTKRVNGKLLPMSDVSGGPQNYGFMANALYDLPLGNLHLPFTPYVGGGIGYSRYDFGSVTGSEPVLLPQPPPIPSLPPLQMSGGGADLPSGIPIPGFPGPGEKLEATGVRTMGNAGAFAYQAIVGAAVPIASIPGLEATVEYRYFGTERVSVRIDTHSPTSARPNVVFDFPNATNVLTRDSSVMFGLRYALFQPKS